MKYIAQYTIYGTANAEIEADSLDEAKEKAEKLDIIEGSDSCNEWSFDELEDVSES